MGGASCTGVSGATASLCPLQLSDRDRYAVDDAALTQWSLSRRADPNAQCLLDITPLFAAVQYAPMSVIELLFEHGGSIAFGQLLNYAAWRELDDRVDVVTFLIAQGAPINNIMYQNRLDCYRQREAFALGMALHDRAAIGGIDVVKTLVDAGAELRIKDSRGETPLQRAERNNHFDVIQYLQPLVERSAPPLRQFTDEISIKLTHQTEPEPLDAAIQAGHLSRSLSAQSIVQCLKNTPH